MSPLLKKALGPEPLNRPGTDILARSLYRELRANGCATEEVLAICTQIISEVTSELRETDLAAPATGASSAA